MRRALTYFLVAAACCADLSAEQKSWNKIRYAGGTVAIKTSPYDWNTTLSVSANPESVTIAIAPARMFSPKQTVKFKPSQITSLSAGSAAWHRVAEVPGAQLPSKTPTLFGLLEHHGYFGIVYETDDGKRGAVLLDSYFAFTILEILAGLSGKPVERSP